MVRVGSVPILTLSYTRWSFVCLGATPVEARSGSEPSGFSKDLMIPKPYCHPIRQKSGLSLPHFSPNVLNVI